jgi:serine/threonine protein kinase
MCIYQLISGNGSDSLPVELKEKIKGKSEREKWLMENVTNMKMNKKSPNKDTKEFLDILTQCLRTNHRDRPTFKELSKRIGVFNSRFVLDVPSIQLPSSGSIEESKEEFAQIEKVGFDMSVEENRNELKKIITQLKTNKPLPIGELKFIGCNLNASRITDITDAMKLNKTVETLSICENKLEREFMREIGSMLKMN